MQLIVNDIDTAPGISFPFQSITIGINEEKMENLLPRNDFMIVAAANLRESQSSAR